MDSEIKVLLIDDDVAVHREVQRQLGSAVDCILCCTDGAEGIRAATQDNPDLVLLDLNMPKMDGLKVCRHLKEHRATRDIPVIFLTMDGDVRHVEKALDCGGSDYVRKPVNEVELRARVRVALRQRRMIEMLRDQARIDALTGLENRAVLDDAMQGAAAAYDRTGSPYALLMVDVDDFKQINDRRGHGVGDDVLRSIGGAIRSACRPYDTACRYGGDEFAVIFGQVEGDAARLAANRILAALRTSRQDSLPQIDFTASAGLASTAVFDEPTSPQTVLKLADDALYLAKRSGKNQLIVANG
jgi:two-component system cell cycle response regulator